MRMICWREGAFAGRRGAGPALRGRRMGPGPGGDLWVAAHQPHQYGRFPENRVVSG